MSISHKIHRLHEMLVLPPKGDTGQAGCSHAKCQISPGPGQVGDTRQQHHGKRVDDRQTQAGEEDSGLTSQDLWTCGGQSWIWLEVGLTGLQQNPEEELSFQLCPYWWEPMDVTPLKSTSEQQLTCNQWRGGVSRCWTQHLPSTKTTM